MEGTRHPQTETGSATPACALASPKCTSRRTSQRRALRTRIGPVCAGCALGPPPVPPPQLRTSAEVGSARFVPSPGPVDAPAGLAVTEGGASAHVVAHAPGGAARLGTTAQEERPPGPVRCVRNHARRPRARAGGVEVVASRPGDQDEDQSRQRNRTPPISRRAHDRRLPGPEGSGFSGASTGDGPCPIGTCGCRLNLMYGSRTPRTWAWSARATPAGGLKSVTAT